MIKERKSAENKGLQDSPILEALIISIQKNPSEEADEIGKKVLEKSSNI